MLTIGEFSKICKVSTKTLRYYETIDLLNPICIKAESGYRYYAIEQLKNMLFINRMKTYGFSLDEIRTLLKWEEQGESKLLQNALLSHRKVLQEQILWMQQTLHELEADVATVQKEEMIMSYLDDIDIQLVEEPEMFLLSTRRMVNMEDCAKGCVPAPYAEEAITRFLPSMQGIRNGWKRKAIPIGFRRMMSTSRIRMRWQIWKRISRKSILRS